MAKGVIIKEVEGWSKHLARTMDDLKHTTMKVGVTEKSGRKAHPENDEVTIGEVAFFNEYGTMTIPARSFIRDWADGHIKEIADDMERAMLLALTRQKTFRDALLSKGPKYRSQIIARILAHIPPPNAQSTIEQKGGDIPLIDSGALVEAIVYEVTKNTPAQAAAKQN